MGWTFCSASLLGRGVSWACSLHRLGLAICKTGDGTGSRVPLQGPMKSKPTPSSVGGMQMPMKVHEASTRPRCTRSCYSPLWASLETRRIFFELFLQKKLSRGACRRLGNHSSRDPTTDAHGFKKCFPQPPARRPGRQAEIDKPGAGSKVTHCTPPAASGAGSRWGRRRHRPHR